MVGATGVVLAGTGVVVGASVGPGAEGSGVEIVVLVVFWPFWLFCCSCWSTWSAWTMNVCQMIAGNVPPSTGPPA